MYFLRNTSGMVPVPNTVEESDQTLPQYFDYGLLNSHPLYMLNQVLTKVYTPLLSYRERPEDHSAGQIKAIKGEDKVDDEKEMRVSLAKLENFSHCQLFCFI